MDLKNARTHVDHAHKTRYSPQHAYTKSIIIQSIFLIVFFLEGVAMNVFLHRAITHGTWGVVAIVGTIVVASFLFYGIIPLRHLWQSIAVVLFLAPMIARPFMWSSIVFGVISIMIFILSLAKMRQMIDNMRQINIGVVIRSGAHGIFFALLVMMSAQYYAMISSARIDDLLPRADRLTLVRVAMERYVIQNSGGGVLTIDNFLEGIIAKQLGTNTSQQPHTRFTTMGEAKVFGQESLTSFLQKITTPALVHSMDQATLTVQKNIITQARKNLSDAIGKKLTGTEDIIDVVILFTRAQIKNAIMHNPVAQQAFPKILTAIFFFTVLSLGIFFRVVAGMLARGICAIAHSAKIFFIVQKVDTIERISLTGQTTTEL